MAKEQIVATLACENPKCRHSLLLEVVRTITKATPPARVEYALQAAGVSLGYVRVHAPGASPKVFCGQCRGRVICRACGIERREDPNGGPFLCASPSFDVDRVIAEGQGDAEDH